MFKYNFRFNASHKISQNEEIHFHTFELACYIENKDELYCVVENKIEKYLDKFKGKYLNDILEKPYIENIAEMIFYELRELEINITKLEFSDKPIQTYIIGVA